MKQTVLFIVTNGVGLGHLTRGLCIAKQLRQIAPHIESVFLSTSLGLEVIREEGFMFYYIPSREQMPRHVDVSQWNDYMKELLERIISFHNPQMIVFDGVYAYGSLIQVMRKNKAIEKIWIRSQELKGKEEKLNKYVNEFDKVIIAGEIGDRRNHEILGEGQMSHVHPLWLIEREEAFEREKVRKEWQIKKGQQVFYVQLGVGSINDIEGSVKCIIERLLTLPRSRIVLSQSIIGKKIEVSDERVQVLKQYPNALYFNGIDFAVVATGYSIIQELVHFEVPMIMIPNQTTKVDDQLQRARFIDESGAGICLEDLTNEHLAQAIYRMKERRFQMKKCASLLQVPNGAREVAMYVKNRLEQRGEV